MTGLTGFLEGEYGVSRDPTGSVGPPADRVLFFRWNGWIRQIAAPHHEHAAVAMGVTPIFRRDDTSFSFSVKLWGCGLGYKLGIICLLSIVLEQDICLSLIIYFILCCNHTATNISTLNSIIISLSLLLLSSSQSSLLLQVIPIMTACIS